MKFISWNTNGLRACVGKGFLDAFNALDADFFCLQETKLQAGQIDLPLDGYSQYWNYAEKKGYSGTAIFAKQAPVLDSRSWTPRGGSLRWNIPAFSSSPATPPTPSGGLPALTTG